MTWSTWVSSVIAACGIALYGTPAAQAQPQPTLPQVNLGYSNYLDGQAPPGWRFQQVVVFYAATTFRDHGGSEQARPRDVESFATLAQLGYISRHKFAGAFVGADVQLPLAHVSLDAGAQETIALGDLIVSPMVLQWPQQELFGRPFTERLSLTFMLPTGEYDSDDAVNIGDNTLRFNPYYAATWEFAPPWEASVRLHYLWNSENHDPPAALNARVSQAGQALHANFDVSYAITPSVRVGLGGYVLQQIADDATDGIMIGGSREHVLGVGPGFMLRMGPTMAAANVYAETGARNRPEGMRVSVRLARSF